VAGVVYDRIAFASPAAEECYRAARVLPPSVSTRHFLELLPRCTCSGVKQKGTVVFLGALEDRKGVPDLLAAWDLLPAHRNSWVLRIMGAGPYDEQVRRAAATDPSIDYIGPAGRDLVHATLRAAEALVLPSRPTGRWCEQIGLPIVEGLAHGCRIVAPPDTGLAPWLREHGQIVLSEAFTTRELADALHETLVSTSTGHESVADCLPAIDSRILAEDWMRAVDPGDLETHTERT
jgi:glycosyltransferase involved in cell wall biosynthesis